MSDTTATTAPSANEPQKAAKPETPRSNQVLSEILNGNFVITILAVVFALIIGAVLIAVTNEDVQKASGYFFAAPGDTLGAVWQAVSGAYGALFQGAIYNFRRDSFVDGIKPLTDTLTFATPLIAAALGIGIAFRVGLFNIGGRGQMLIAAACAGWVGFSFELPWGVHLVIAVVAGIAGGAIWGGLVGFLKARTGAHEVILTIMLNYVAFYLISWMLRTPGLLQAPGSVNPKSPPMMDTAVFPDILGPKYNLHLGFVFVIAATIFAWWLLNRSSLGFQFRAVGENPNAARVAGINVKNTYVQAMLISGGLVGLAGVMQVLGTVTTGFSAGIDAGIGFDAITVALLGRSRPWGIFAAGVLFGAFKAGGFAMQAAEGIPIDIVTVVQSLIVLFIAAPPLIRAVFFLPQGKKSTKLKLNVSKEVAAK
ncbi:simple sugar transport system permease protein [Okibacterium sp. HSC-33S16]|uniref:ABC transporter permease n=1 Tax=Okibacterium sp. HSC-33S16 TaxID=2910965 RepID=UPI0020A02077|nr:ABC transporter permease [Okibacterium sp. HSC-33S16]MCP2031632.1 simple sugar transport system permease protein [Okibacterium sp. HSC-33S16]